MGNEHLFGIAADSCMEGEEGHNVCVLGVVEGGRQHTPLRKGQLWCLWAVCRSQLKRLPHNKKQIVQKNCSVKLS